MIAHTVGRVKRNFSLRLETEKWKFERLQRVNSKNRGKGGNFEKKNALAERVETPRTLQKKKIRE